MQTASLAEFCRITKTLRKYTTTNYTPTNTSVPFNAARLDSEQDSVGRNPSHRIAVTHCLPLAGCGGCAGWFDANLISHWLEYIASMVSVACRQEGDNSRTMDRHGVTNEVHCTSWQLPKAIVRW